MSNKVLYDLGSFANSPPGRCLSKLINRQGQSDFESGLASGGGSSVRGCDLVLVATEKIFYFNGRD